MATYHRYPTPPQTSSPKHSTNYQQEPNSQPYEYSGEPSPFTTGPPLPNPQSTSAHKVPAQESYFHSFSAPGSPRPTDVPSQPPKPSPYPRRRSSPLFGPGGVPYNQPSRPFSPSTMNRLSPRPIHSSPRPIHFSPSNPVPSPYSAGRPKPRPGFLKRIAMKLAKWIKGFASWSKNNPLTAGILTFIPVMAIVGVAKIARVVGKGLGYVEKGYGRPGKIGGGGNKGLSGSGWALDEFKGFGGNKNGPLESFLKTVRMLV